MNPYEKIVLEEWNHRSYVSLVGFYLMYHKFKKKI